MSNMSKRGFLALGLGATALAGIGYAMRRSGGAGFENTFLTVEEMTANGGLIVDIRTPQEWHDTGVIDGAKLVTFQDPQSFLARIGPEIADGRDLILICRSGNRSARAAQALEGRIPNHIISIAGGMSKEIASGYRPVPPS